MPSRAVNIGASYVQGTMYIFKANKIFHQQLQSTNEILMNLYQ